MCIALYCIVLHCDMVPHIHRIYCITKHQFTDVEEVPLEAQISRPTQTACFILWISPNIDQSENYPLSIVNNLTIKCKFLSELKKNFFLNEENAKCDEFFLIDR